MSAPRAAAARPRFERLPTERVDPRSRRLDRLSSREIARVMNRADGEAMRAVGRAGPAVARAVDAIARSLARGGRLLFAGAGTSGRLGVLEAAECPPTFGTPPSLVQAVMAGGRGAVFRSREGAEDDRAAGMRAIRRRARAGDVVVGVAASGVTPFVHGALAAGRRRGAATVLLTCNPSVSRRAADLVIALAVGPEVLAGSTRLKAGTATKLVLNTLTTAAFTRLGKVHGNRMVDVRPSSAKLRARARQLVREIGGVDARAAARLLRAARGRVKVAVVMGRLGLTAVDARRRLDAARGVLAAALASPPSPARARIVGGRGRRSRARTGARLPLHDPTASLRNSDSDQTIGTDPVPPLQCARRRRARDFRLAVASVRLDNRRQSAPRANGSGARPRDRARRPAARRRAAGGQSAR